MCGWMPGVVVMSWTGFEILVAVFKVGILSRQEETKVAGNNARVFHPTDLELSEL